VEPTDHTKFWAIGEYADDWAIIPNVTTTARAIWHTYIAEIGFSERGEVPEPAGYALVAIALLGLTASRRQKTR
jgi:hypothetical protein